MHENLCIGITRRKNHLKKKLHRSLSCYSTKSVRLLPAYLFSACGTSEKCGWLESESAFCQSNNHFLVILDQTTMFFVDWFHSHPFLIWPLKVVIKHCQGPDSIDVFYIKLLSSVKWPGIIEARNIELFNPLSYAGIALMTTLQPC